MQTGRINGPALADNLQRFGVDLAFETDLLVVDVNNSQITTSGNIATSASTTARAGLNIPEGVAPTSPNDGDMWITAAGEFFVRLNGASVDLAAGGGGLFSEDADENIIGGTGAGASLTATSGVDNFLGGVNAGTNITTGDRNVAIGNTALDAAVTSVRNTAIGYNALGRLTGSSNTAVGDSAGEAITSGAANVAIGQNSLSNASSSLTGSGNVAIGGDAMGSAVMTTAGDNIAINASMSALISGTFNIALGGVSLNRLTTATGNVAIGEFSGAGITTGFQNTALGYEALSNQTGSLTGGTNVALGRRAMYSSVLAAANDNIAIGQLSLAGLSSGDNNIAIGEGAGDNITTGSNNICIGSNAGPTGNQSNRLYIDDGETDTPFIGGSMSTGLVELAGSIRFTERADHISTPAATFGEIWVRNDAPNVPVFTDDAGTDHDMIPTTGSWTPVVSDGTNDCTMTNQSGSYTVIGNICFITCHVTVNSIASASGPARITGLPFTAANISAGHDYPLAMGEMASLAVAADLIPMAQVENNTTYITLHVFQSAGSAATTTMSISQVSNGGDLKISGHYEIA